MTAMNERTVRCFYAEHGDISALAGTRTAIIGYGNLGRSMALNLRDSGCPPTVGNVDDDYAKAAIDDGFTPLAIGDAVAAADIVLVMLPDEVIPEVFERDVAPALRPGAALCFASGYVLAYGLVPIPDGVDVLMIAPRMLGQEVRRRYVAGDGFFSYVSVEQDATGEAERRLLALAAATGTLCRGAVEMSAKSEALLDLFIEQSFGTCLGLALQTAFEVGVHEGLPPEALVLELYMSGEMSRTISAFADLGFYDAVTQHGLTATYGGFVRLPMIDTEAMKKFFAETLDDIREGRFAARFQEEHAAGYPTITAIQEITQGDNPIRDAERALRASFPSLRPS